MSSNAFDEAVASSQDPANSFDQKRDSLLSAINTTKEFIQELSEYSKSKVTFYLPATNASPYTFKVLKLHQPFSHQSFATKSTSDEDPLRTQLSSVCQHLVRISGRLEQNTSKILVTGDLNAGKSTFINALLGGYHILPSDQQPCTMAFCEVVQAEPPTLPHSTQHQHPVVQSGILPNQGKIVVHAFTNGHSEEEHSTPNKTLTIDEMQQLAADSDSPFTWYRIWYPQSVIYSQFQDPYISYSLIDSPGLNTDFLKTMSLFTKQEDIDVVVFLINASNHLTLSARDFLMEAAKEKSLVFTVVNRMDEIRDKEKCKRTILSQIREVLPLTFGAQSELIHFVSAIEHLKKNENELARHSSQIKNGEKELGNNSPQIKKDGNELASNSSHDENTCSDWIHLIDSLKRFVFVKRTQSKLCPAKTFLLNLLEDLSFLLDSNKSVYNERYQRVSLELTTSESEWEHLQASQDKLLDSLSTEIDKNCTQIYTETRTRLLEFTHSIESVVGSVEWQGFTKISWFVKEVQSVLVRKAHHEMLEARKEALETVTATIYSLYQHAQTLLPQIYDNGESGQVHPDIPGTLSCAEPIIYKDDLNLSTLEAVAFSFSFPFPFIDWMMSGLSGVPVVGWFCSMVMGKSQSNSFKWIRAASFTVIGVLGIRFIGKPLWSIASLVPFGKTLLCVGAAGWVCATMATPRSIRASLVQQAQFHYSTVGASAPFRASKSPDNQSNAEPVESNLAFVEQFPRLLEGGARKLLRIPSNELMSKWHAWMTKTRRDRQEREGMRRRWASTVEYFEQTRGSLISFRRTIESIHL